MKPKLAILGAGPVGLEAALAAAEGGYPFALYEAGDGVAAAVRSWGHVRLFSPWSLNVSPRARRLLAAVGLELPADDTCPTGEELVERLFEPLAAQPSIAPHLRLGERVVAVSRDGLVKSDEIGTGRRAERPFRLLIRDASGGERIDRADRVLDCTGTYDCPNQLGDGGIAAPGEAAAEGAIERQIPRIDSSWAGLTTLLVGAGYSAQTAVRDLAELAEREPGTRVLWALRREDPLPPPPEDDPLPERAALAATAGALSRAASPAVETRFGVVVEALEAEADRWRVTLRRRDDRVETVVVDRILSLTGYVGDHRLYRQLQVHECYATAGPMKLAAALLGSAGGDCLDQTGHGGDSLLNPEPGFFLLGSKSYGRNPTFLMRLGWEQVDEVFALWARDRAA
ncbi:MAG: flavoprotein [Acidobacteriota bacterium]